MPTYVELCAHCGHTQDFIRNVSARDHTDEHCGEPMQRQGAWAVAPQIAANFWTGHKGAFMPDGKNGGQGTWVESSTDWNRYLKQNGKSPAQEAQQEAQIQRSNREQADNKSLTNAVEQAIRKHSA